MKYWFFSLLILGLSVAWAAPYRLAFPDGVVEGRTVLSDQVAAFTGIRYATSTRWRAPVPVALEGSVDATGAGFACPQLGVVSVQLGGSMPPQQEDCLFLNVWSPLATPPEGGWPVMVYIHGGSFTGGSGGEAIYDGALLASRGVIVVTINYRLGTLGYLALPALAAEDRQGSTGNYGILDQILALQWVQKYIGLFGGNPELVTLFGQSAGGMSICTLMASPLAQGLFAQAIIQSGGCIYAHTLEKGYQDAAKIGERVGCSPGNLTCWRTLPVAKLAEQPGEYPATDFAANPYKPHIDGYVLTELPIEALRAGKAAGVRLIAGANAEEFPVALARVVPNVFGWDPLEREIRRVYPENWERIMEAYRLEFTDPREAFIQYAIRRLVYCPSLAAARVQSTYVPSYAYVFDYRSPLLAAAGSFHGLELAFVFGNLGTWPYAALFAERQVFEAALPLRETIQDLWVDFARGETPQVGLMRWPTIAEGYLMQLDVRSGWRPDPYAESCTLLEE